MLGNMGQVKKPYFKEHSKSCYEMSIIWDDLGTLENENSEN